MPVHRRRHTWEPFLDKRELVSEVLLCTSDGKLDTREGARLGKLS